MTQDGQKEAPMWFIALVTMASLVLVASVGAVVWLAQQDAASADPADDADLRGDLIGVAEQYFVEANTYDFTNVPDYKSRVHPLMT